MPGNVKRLSKGSIKGMLEIKLRIGNSRTHRAFFRYLPATGEVILLRVIARDKLGSVGWENQLVEWMNDDFLLASMYTPDPATIPLLHEVRAKDLDIILGP